MGKEEIQNSPGTSEHEFNQQFWSGMGEGDVGRPFNIIEYSSAVAQLTGSPSGAAVQLCGRVDAQAEFIPLPDSVVKTGKLCYLQLGVIEIQPKVVGGNADTKLNVAILFKR